jgi:hypothetical protein
VGGLAGEALAGHHRHQEPAHDCVIVNDEYTRVTPPVRNHFEAIEASKRAIHHPPIGVFVS